MSINKKKNVSTATLLARHVKQTSTEVRAEWPKWKQVLFMPRKPRNGFKA